MQKLLAVLFAAILMLGAGACVVNDDEDPDAVEVEGDDGSADDGSADDGSADDGSADDGSGEEEETDVEADVDVDEESS